MNCERWRDLASDHVEGSLAAEAHAEADRHLATCPSCRADAEFLKGMSATFREVPSEDAPLFFSDNVRSRIEAARRAQSPVSLRDRLGRLGLATAFVGTAVAGMFWGAIFPSQRTVVPATMAPALPAAKSTPTRGAVPKLAVGWNRRVDANDPAMDVQFSLSGAERGAVRCDIPGDRNAYRFTLSGGVPQTLRVPLAAARGDRTLAVGIHWNAGEAGGSRQVFLPLPNADQAPSTKQSFSLPELPAHDALRELSRRYGVAVVADNLPAEARLSFRAVDETLDTVVRNAVAEMGWQVDSGPDGVRVSSSR
jgi:hypothetical protein